MISKATVAKLLAGTTLIGSLTFGTLKWAGSSDIEAVQNMYNRLYDNYQTALGNITVYKNELTRRKDLIDGANTKQQALQQRIDELEQQLEQAQGGSEEDKALIAELEQQIANLQAQLNDGITDEQYNQLTAEIERLQGELTKANTEVATLKEQIAAKDASITDIEAVTAEEVQAGTDIADLYFTFATKDGNTAVDEYLNSLQVTDMYNQSPAQLVRAQTGTRYLMPNMIAFQQCYDKVNGDGAFETAYNEAYATYANMSDMTDKEKVYNAVIQLNFKINVNGQEWTIQYDDGQITPNGETKTIEDWMQNGSLIIY